MISPITDTTAMTPKPQAEVTPEEGEAPDLEPVPLDPDPEPLLPLPLPDPDPEPELEPVAVAWLPLPVPTALTVAPVYGDAVTV